jgi:hypothetical protein
MTRSIIGFPRVGDQFTLSGGSYEMRYPINNLQNDKFARCARTTSLNYSDTLIRGVSASVVPARAFMICAHNMTLDAAYRLRLYDNTNGSPSELMYDSDVQRLWQAPYGYAGRIWETFNFWTGDYTESELEGQIPDAIILLDDFYYFDEFLLEFFDASNSDGYVQIGMLDINQGWEVSVKPETGAEFGYNQTTRTQEIEGDLVRFEIFTPSYVFRGVIPVMDRIEVQNKASELFRQHGIHKPFMWLPEPDEKSRWLREGKMVRLADTSLFSYVTDEYDAVPLNLIQWKG